MDVDRELYYSDNYEYSVNSLLEDKTPSYQDENEI